MNSAKTLKVGGRVFNLKVITVEPVMFLYMYMSFTQFLTLQALLYDKVCHEHFNSTVCENLKNDTLKSEEDVVQKSASTWLLYANIAMGIPSLLTVLLFLGPWGDRVGRKIPVLFPLVGALLVSISYLINSIYMELSVSYLLIGTFLNGLFGGYIAALMAMYSYVAHISTVKNRTIRLGILEAMIFLSATLGTGTSGIMLDRTSYAFVFSLLCGVSVIALVYALLWLDNVVPDQEGNGETKNWCRSLFLDPVKDICLCVYGKRHNKNFLNLALLMVIIFFLQLVVVGENDIILLFTRSHPFNWSQTTLGLYKCTETFLRGISVLTLLPFCKRKLRVRDTTVIICGLVSKTAAMLVLGIGTTTAVLFVGAISGILQGFSSAGIRSLCSGMVQSNEQGKMFSLMGIFESFAQLAATSLFNTVYKSTLSFYHGFCFLMAAGIVGSNIILAVFLHKRLPESDYETLEEVECSSENVHIQDGQEEEI